MSNSDTVLRFVGLINHHDVKGMVALMARDHLFIDSLGRTLAFPEVELGWNQYLKMVPDYWIRVDRTIADGPTVVLIGEAGGTYAPSGKKPRRENEWKTPAVWVAKVKRGKVSEWRVYADNEPVRAKMR